MKKKPIQKNTNEIKDCEEKTSILATNFSIVYEGTVNNYQSLLITIYL